MINLLLYKTNQLVNFVLNFILLREIVGRHPNLGLIVAALSKIYFVLFVTYK